MTKSTSTSMMHVVMTMAFDPKVQIMYVIKRGKESESEKESWGGELSTKLTAGSLTISYHTLPCALRCSFLKGGGGVPASLGREGRGRQELNAHTYSGRHTC